MKKFTLAACTAGTLLLSGISHAGFDGTQSYNVDIEVGESVINGGPHTAGKAGIGVAAFGSTQSKVDFQGLALSSSQSNGIYTLASGHGGLGAFNFAQVGAGDVWFGEWAEDITGGGTNDGKRAVYYIGDDQGTTVPTSGTATYSVKGVNHYTSTQNNQLSGTFTADFGAQTLNGALSHGALVIDIDTNIDLTTAEFSGTATTVLANGTATGHFFGADAAALAGIAQFPGVARGLDTAFGGTKD
ncbi:Slam-dependent surface lipoprotein [Microbulbifer sp. 2304DJ12-6]|uniref:Slam-dependent surface lipoprotein n=1 Tax=Microbulbifer sp. 2304DJ12-6 TaxID=3233340 RepID=UPI0039AE9BEA